MVSRYFVYKQALMGEAERLVQAGVLRETEDIFYLTFEELQRRRAHESASTSELIRQRRTRSSRIERSRRRACSRRTARASPARTGATTCRPARWSASPFPPARSRGARASFSTSREADLEPGDILVTAYTDPSWTPLFVAIKGLVTEVGGLMTHGAVIAREYGLPAVVGVGACDAADPRRPADSRARHGRVRRAPGLIGRLTARTGARHPAPRYRRSVSAETAYRSTCLRAERKRVSCWFSAASTQARFVEMTRLTWSDEPLIVDCRRSYCIRRCHSARATVRAESNRWTAVDLIGNRGDAVDLEEVPLALGKRRTRGLRHASACGAKCGDTALTMGDRRGRVMAPPSEWVRRRQHRQEL